MYRDQAFNLAMDRWREVKRQSASGIDEGLLDNIGDETTSKDEQVGGNNPMMEEVGDKGELELGSPPKAMCIGLFTSLLRR